MKENVIQFNREKVKGSQINKKKVLSRNLCRKFRQHGREQILEYAS